MPYEDTNLFEEMLLGAWVEFQPYIIPFFIILALIIFRGKLAEMLAEGKFVYNTRLGQLQKNPSEITQKQMLKLWSEFCQWQRSLHQVNKLNPESKPFHHELVENYKLLADFSTTIKECCVFFSANSFQKITNLQKKSDKEIKIWSEAGEKSPALLADCLEALNKLEKNFDKELSGIIKSDFLN